MRTVRDPQIKFGEVDIAAIELDLKSRDDILPILRGLQYIYTTPELREAVFKILARVIPSRNGPGLTNEQRHQKADRRLGRPGMEQLKILVLGTLRLGLNTDYDRIHESWPTSTPLSGRCSYMEAGRTKRHTTGRRSRITCVFSHRRFWVKSVSWS